MAAAESSRSAAFIRKNTVPLSPPLVPEIRLHLAEESLPIWLKTEEELQQHNIDPPYWAFAWAGGQALARYVLDNPTLVRGKRVLDLGSGSGLVAIAACRAGAASALAADVDQLASVAAEVNAALNSVTLTTTANDMLVTGAGKFDVVLVGDLFYEAQLAKKVLTFIEVNVSAGVIVLVGDPRRSYFPLDRFEKLTEYTVPVTRQLEDAEIKRTAIWRYKPG
ncbi:50S ribosomal protein L11 methyltransferase [Filomicrobium sp.]|uniref:class I SAM-dependent methyltransferase n=1 Tax=Filomicrobium sp. TaxID=2024831 RepID=UPI0025842F2B|nr:50S ribosomal protein L11 methyltransferase [Filomicrobium sp.]MCV0368383.1 50S ribosomal protein L11 methyltransferase [Filomicrobium sp.]